MNVNIAVTMLFLCSLCVSKIVCSVSLPMLSIMYCVASDLYAGLCLECFLRVEDDLHAVYEDHLLFPHDLFITLF